MDPNLLLAIILIILFWGIFVVIILSWEKSKKAREIQKTLNTRVFLVTLPREVPSQEVRGNEPTKDFRQLISVAEQMFTAISSLHAQDFSNKILKSQEQISFEIVAQRGVVSFYVSCPKMVEEMVEKQIQASYPTAHLERVKSPNIFNIPGHQGEFATASLKLSKKFILPIKTYLALESDPLSGVTNAMSKLGETSAAAFQMIIKPTSQDWRRASGITARKIQDGKSTVDSEDWYIKALTGFFDILSGIFHGSNKTQPPIAASTDKNKPYVQLTPMQEGLLKAINEKAGKTGFETAIRIVTVGSDQTVAQSQLQAITSSFAQFGTPELNSFKVSSGNAQLVKDYILRRFSKKGFILNTEELATLYHFPNYNVETPNIEWLQAKEFPPPPNLPEAGTVLGKSVYRGEEKIVKIKPEDRRRHIFMIGKTGVGKTTLFSNAFEEDMREGRGVCFIDPLGDAIEDLLGKVPQERQRDVILFDPADAQYPLGLNLMEYKTPDQRDFLIQEAIQIFYKLFDPTQMGIVGPQWEHWFRNAALTIMSQPGGGTLIDIPRIFTDDGYRTKLISYIQDPLVKSFWTQQLAKTADFHKSEMYNYFISKFGRFMTNDLIRNIIGQKKSSFDIREAMDAGKILLINLSKGKIGEVNSNLLGMIIVSKIQMEAFSRADIPEEERRDFYLYVDEFQNFTTDSFATILSEARKYHLNLNVTNQYIAQLTEKIRDAVVGNAGTLISYRIGAADAEFIAKEFPGVSVSDLTNLDRYNTYIKLLVDGTPSKPFNMQGIKSETVSDVNLREQVRNLSRQTYGRPLAQVEQEISENFKNGENNGQR